MAERNFRCPDRTAEAAQELASKAAEAKAEFRELLPRYFPEAKK